VLIGVSGITKKITRGSEFRWEDFYLGMDLTLAALSVAAVNILELPPLGGTYTAWFVVITVILLFLQVAFHQDWGRPENLNDHLKSGHT